MILRSGVAIVRFRTDESGSRLNPACGNMVSMSRSESNCSVNGSKGGDRRARLLESVGGTDVGEDDLRKNGAREVVPRTRCIRHRESKSRGSWRC